MTNLINPAQPINKTKSVGRYGINIKDDVMFIQTALNTYTKKHASNTFPLKVDDLFGKKTIQAIFSFQKQTEKMNTKLVL